MGVEEVSKGRVRELLVLGRGVAKLVHIVMQSPWVGKRSWDVRMQGVATA